MLPSRHVTNLAYFGSGIIRFCYLPGINTPKPAYYESSCYRAGMLPSWHFTEPAYFGSGIILFCYQSGIHTTDPAYYESGLILFCYLTGIQVLANYGHGMQLNGPGLQGPAYCSGIVWNRHTTDMAYYRPGILHIRKTPG